MLFREIFNGKYWISHNKDRQVVLSINHGSHQAILKLEREEVKQLIEDLKNRNRLAEKVKTPECVNLQSYEEDQEYLRKFLKKYKYKQDDEELDESVDNLVLQLIREKKWEIINVYTGKSQILYFKSPDSNRFYNFSEVRNLILEVFTENILWDYYCSSFTKKINEILPSKKFTNAYIDISNSYSFNLRQVE